MVKNENDVKGNWNVETFLENTEVEPSTVNIGALLWLEPGKYNMNDTIGNITEAKKIEDIDGTKYLISPKAISHHFMKTLLSIIRGSNFDSNSVKVGLSYALAIENDNIRLKVHKITNKDLENKLKKTNQTGVKEYVGNLDEIVQHLSVAGLKKVKGKGNNLFIVSVRDINKNPKTGNIEITLRLINLPEFIDKESSKMMLDSILIQEMIDYDLGGGVLPTSDLQLNRRRVVGNSGLVTEPEYTSGDMLVEARQATEQSKEAGQMLMNMEYMQGLAKIVFSVEVWNIGYSNYGGKHVISEDDIKFRAYLAVMSILKSLFNLSKNEQKGTITPLIVTVTKEPLTNATPRTTVDPTNYTEDTNAIIYINKDIDYFIKKDNFGKIKEAYETVSKLKNNGKFTITGDYKEFIKEALGYVEKNYF